MTLNFAIRQEGNLFKYTNVVKGYQIRYFIVNTITAKLNYYMSEDAKTQKPRGSIELLNSIISPSEEDSTTFTINTPDNEIFKLRAQDAKERQHWVNILRLVSQSKTENEFKTYEKSDSTNNQKKETYNEQNQTLKLEQTLTKHSNEDLIKEIFSLIKTSHEEFERSIENLPKKDSPICRYDQDLLILKSIANSCVNNLINSCKILNIREENKFNEPELITSLSNSQRLEFANKNLLDVSFHNSTNETKIEFSGNSPKKPLVNPDDEITEDEDDLSKKKSDQDQDKSESLKFFSNLTEGIDLSKISIPIRMFEKKSLLELFADIMSHTDQLIKIADEKTPEDRFISVVQWYLSSFNLIKKQFSNKKPFNPILGEVFNCSWKTVDETNKMNVVSYTAEQVSHHPPISAFYMECKSKKLKVNSNLITKSTYSGTSVSIKLLGEMILKLEKHSEEYHITFPRFYTRSIVTNPWIELGDSCTINCAQTGYKANIEFEVKSFYGEKINQVFAEIKDKHEDVICRIKGEWDSKMEYIFGSESTKIVKTVDLKSMKTFSKRVRPINIQEENESRKVWEDVVSSMNNLDFESAQNSKAIVEKQQRLTEKLRKEKNLGYICKSFYKSKIINEKLSSTHLSSKSNNLCESDTELTAKWLHKNWSS